MHEAFRRGFGEVVKSAGAQNPMAWVKKLRPKLDVTKTLPNQQRKAIGDARGAISASVK